MLRSRTDFSKEDRLLLLINEHFRATSAHEAALDLSDLFTVILCDIFPVHLCHVFLCHRCTCVHFRRALKSQVNGVFILVITSVCTNLHTAHISHTLQRDDIQVVDTRWNQVLFLQVKYPRKMSWRDCTRCEYASLLSFRQ